MSPPTIWNSLEDTLLKKADVAPSLLFYLISSLPPDTPYPGPWRFPAFLAFGPIVFLLQCLPSPHLEKCKLPWAVLQKWPQNSWHPSNRMTSLCVGTECMYPQYSMSPSLLALPIYLNFMHLFSKEPRLSGTWQILSWISTIGPSSVFPHRINPTVF